jgi:predicted nuclease with TOPRIM domain
MTASTNNDIKELKELINSRFDAIDRRFDKLENRFDSLDERVKALEIGQTKLEANLGKIEARLDDWKPSINKISDLAEKVGELKNWRQIALIVISAVLAATLGWWARSGKP